MQVVQIIDSVCLYLDKNRNLVGKVVGVVTVDGCREEGSHPICVEQHDPQGGHEAERLNDLDR